MKIIFTILVFLSLQLTLLGNNFCDVKTLYSYNFGTLVIRSQVTKNIDISNNGNSIVTLNSVLFNSHYADYISFPDFQSPVEISPGESYNLKVVIDAKQNIEFTGILFLNVSCSNFQYSIPVEIKAHITTGGEASITDNLYGPDLIDAISGYFQNHKSYSYKDARKLFWGSFDKKDGLVECIYTGKTIDPGVDPDFSELDGLGFNTEHTWPRSLGASNEPAESDINHLFVADKQANDKRANYPFGYVSSNITYENSGSKLGKNSNGETVFEVRDIYKGNIARAIFYFALRYNNPNKFLDKQENDLRDWFELDPVDASELARNDSVKKYQNRSNLFIQYPELLERIPSITLRTYPDYVPNYFVSDTILKFDLSKFDATATSSFYVTNFNNNADSTITIESINLTGDVENFELIYDDGNKIIPPNSYRKFDVLCYNYNEFRTANIEIKFQSGISKSISIKATDPSMSINENGLRKFNIYNYPNPATNNTRIIVENIEDVSLIRSVKVYDMLSNEVANISNTMLLTGNNYSVDFAPTNYNLSGQIYFVRFELSSGNNIIHPIIFLN